jgi:hypothetical protein
VTDPLAPETWIGLDLVDGTRSVHRSQGTTVLGAIIDAAVEAAQFGRAIRLVLLLPADWWRLLSESEVLRLEPGETARIKLYGPTGAIAVEMAP